MANRALILTLALLLSGCGAFRSISPRHPQATEREQLIADFYTIHTQAEITLKLMRQHTLCAADPDGETRAEQGLPVEPCPNDGQSPSLTPLQFANLDDKYDAAQAKLKEARDLFQAFEASNQDPALALASLAGSLGYVIAANVDLRDTLRVTLPSALAATIALLELQRQRVEREARP